MNERKEKEGGCRCSASHSTGTCFLDRWSVQHMLSNCRSLSTVISIYVGIVRFHGEAVALSPWLAYCQSSSPSPCCSRGFQKNRVIFSKENKKRGTIDSKRTIVLFRSEEIELSRLETGFSNMFTLLRACGGQL